MIRHSLWLGPVLSLIAKVAFATQIFLISGTTWTVPTDWNSTQNKIEVIGFGGKSYVCLTGGPAQMGGGGAAYSASTNLTFTPGATVNINFTDNDSASSPTRGSVWFGSSTTILAQNGENGCRADFPNGGQGGQASAGFGTTKFSGGLGGLGSGSGTGAGAGGGAAGPFGAGANADQSGSGVFGGAADNGHGGVGGFAGNMGVGGNGTEFDASHGSGGGGQTEATGMYSGMAGNYGGGGGFAQALSHGAGLIVITYTPRRRVSSGVFD